jgi:hypothetical protein
MLLGPRLGFLMQPVDEHFQLFSIHAPDPSPSYLDRWEFPGPDQGVDLRHAHAQIGRDVLIVLMTSALVVAIWGVARDRLIAIVSAALSSVCGSLGC